jgi:hypothetical protein
LLDETLPDKHFLVTDKKMKKLLRKGAIGALLYVQALHLQEHGNPILSSIEKLL